MEDSSKILVLLEQVFKQLLETNYLLRNIQSTLLPLGEMVVELRASQQGADLDQMKADFGKKCDMHFEELKKESAERHEKLSGVLSECLYGKALSESAGPDR